MPVIISKMLQETLKSEFKSEGFKKKGANWGNTSNDIAKLFNIQCSQNSERVYFNIGIYLQTEGKVEFPRQIDCHLRLRLEELFDSEKEIISFYELSNFEGCLDNNEKVKEIGTIVIDKVIPWFSDLNSITDLLNSEKITPTMYWNNGQAILEKLRVNKG